MFPRAGQFVTSSIYMGKQVVVPWCDVYQPLWGGGLIVTDAVSRGLLPVDGNGIYVVLGSRDIPGLFLSVSRGIHVTGPYH